MALSEGYTPEQLEGAGFARYTWACELAGV